MDKPPASTALEQLNIPHHQIWRQLHCRLPAVQLLAKLPLKTGEPLFIMCTSVARHALRLHSGKEHALIPLSAR
jgi:hypothetical protein